MNDKIKICITGSHGLLGWHVRYFLMSRSDVEVIPCDRQQFNDDIYLEQCVQNANAIIHLAGVNRGSEESITDSNRSITNRLLKTLRDNDCRPHVLFSSSTHIDRDSAYGKSKRDSAKSFEAWAEAEDARFCNLVLPNIYGEFGKPFYNSVVSTFCHQLANRETPEVKQDSEIELMHAYDLAKFIWENIDNGTVGQVRAKGTRCTVSELKSTLTNLSTRYFDGVVPQLDSDFELRLFNTLRSYIGKSELPVDLTTHKDDRGSLFETIRCDGTGQVFFSTTKPGITRGNHFHTHKVERFVVLQGSAEIKLRRIGFSETTTYKVRGSKPQAIDIPTFHTHNIKNTGDTPLLTLFWSGEHFDPDHPDTFPLDVECCDEVLV